jgi:hypothetical protein
MMTDAEQWEQDHKLMIHYQRALQKINDGGIDPIKIAADALINFLPEYSDLTYQPGLVFNTWACRFCDGIFVNYDTAVIHATECNGNPGVKGCETCKIPSMMIGGVSK